ncbi:MAG: ribosome biogenesis GTPase YlqF [Azoarcus sp.]|jgi:ribosome biogenesis GTPase A|nr:ribosome biogenesis GTPase YlqF [Azoarcus sp.]
MPAVQWFPGHMNAARRAFAKALAVTDVVIEVTDARLPGASSNPMIEELRHFRNRPCLKLLNKADLADSDATRAWIAYYSAQPNVLAVAVSAKNPADIGRIPALAQQLAPHRSGAEKPLRMILAGIPNVGKSTLMNALLKRRVAQVGDEPAVTKSQQTLDLGPGMTLTDTPGLMWPKIEHDTDGFMLAASHAIGRNAVADEEVAINLGIILLARYPALVETRYKFSAAGLDGESLLELIAQRRGCMRKGGGLDLEKAANILLNDYRAGTLGRITLETPESRRGMLQSGTNNALSAESGDLSAC